MAIRFYDEDIPKQKIGRKILTKWIKEEILRRKKIPGELNIVLTSDTYLRKLNKRHLSRDYYTDILSFDYSEADSVSGELFISIDRVRENAVRFKVSYDKELRRVIIHGILHLLGYSDESEQDKEVMRKEENKSLAQHAELIKRMARS